MFRLGLGGENNHVASRSDRDSYELSRLLKPKKIYIYPLFWRVCVVYDTILEYLLYGYKLTIIFVVPSGAID